MQKQHHAREAQARIEKLTERQQFAKTFKYEPPSLSPKEASIRPGTGATSSTMPDRAQKFDNLSVEERNLHHAQQARSRMTKNRTTAVSEQLQAQDAGPD
jgi:hypothetical protein